MRLGRTLEHDDRSWNFQAARAPQIKTVLHKRTRKPLDQGDLGMCTGCAMTGLLDTQPFTHTRLSETTAKKLYSWATSVDDSPGQYPPTDTGSSGLAVAKAALHYRYIRSYSHAFGLQHALEALTLSPVITGINWYSSFDEPASNGEVTITPNADIRGGHEVEVLGLDTSTHTILLCNSWGSDWGQAGRFSMTFTTWDRLLTEDGDVTTAA